jgi:hypothetical protein
MKSRKKIVAGMVAMALGSGAYAATFEGRLACDKDPREAGTSCMLYVPVTDTVGLPVYTQQISVSYLLEPRAAAAAGMEATPALGGEISASAPMTESFSSAPPKQAALSNDSSVYPRSEVAEGKPASDMGDRQASTSSSRGGLFSWFKSDRSGISGSDSRSRDLASTSLMESDHLAGTEPGSEQSHAASSSGRGIFSWLTGDRPSRTISERPAAIDAQPSSSVVGESSSGGTGIVASTSEARTSSRSGVFGWLTAGSSDERTRDLASTSLMESDHLAGTEPSAYKQATSDSSRPAFFSRFFGDRGSRSMSGQSAAIESQQSEEQIAITESSADGGTPRDLASTSLMESASPEQGEDPSRS